jgi:hypothetical protein
MMRVQRDGLPRRPEPDAGPRPPGARTRRNRLGGRSRAARWARRRWRRPPPRAAGPAAAPRPPGWRSGGRIPAAPARPARAARASAAGGGGRGRGEGARVCGARAGGEAARGAARRGASAPGSGRPAGGQAPARARSRDNSCVRRAVLKGASLQARRSAGGPLVAPLSPSIGAPAAPRRPSARSSAPPPPQGRARLPPEPQLYVPLDGVGPADEVEGVLLVAVLGRGWGGRGGRLVLETARANAAVSRVRGWAQLGWGPIAYPGRRPPKIEPWRLIISPSEPGPRTPRPQDASAPRTPHPHDPTPPCPLNPRTPGPLEPQDPRTPGPPTWKLLR